MIPAFVARGTAESQGDRVENSADDVIREPIAHDLPLTTASFAGRRSVSMIAGPADRWPAHGPSGLRRNRRSAPSVGMSGEARCGFFSAELLEAVEEKSVPSLITWARGPGDPGCPELLRRSAVDEPPLPSLVKGMPAELSLT